MVAESFEGKASHGGRELLEALSALTGFPQDVLSAHVQKILGTSGRSDVDLDQLDLDTLRHALMDYLEDLEAKSLADS